MRQQVQNLKTHIMNNTPFYFRIVLFLTFFGHGLVSLGLSPSYAFHHKIMSVANIFPIATSTALIIQGIFDIVIAVLILIRRWPRIVLPISILYLLAVGVVAWITYYVQTAEPTGVVEVFRRLPWLFFALYLYQYETHTRHEYYWLRVGIGFAFFAHGIASLGLTGFKTAHVDLAANIVPQKIAPTLVYYSGFFDTAVGLLLIIGVLSRFVAVIGIPWLALIDYSSFIKATPDGIFRLGFLLALIYVALDKQVHKDNILTIYRRWRSPASTKEHNT